MSAPGIFIDAAPSIPTSEDRTTRALPGTKDVTAKTLAPEQLGAIAQQDDLLKSETAVAGNALVANQAKNAADAEEAKQLAEAKAQAEKDKTAALASSQANIEQYASKLREANDRYTSAPMPSLFHSGDAGRDALKGIGLLFAAIGDARKTTAMLRLGQSPGANSAVDEIIDRDFAVQREAIAKLKDNAVMAAAGLKDAEESRKLLLASIDVRQAAVYDRIAAFGVARQKALGSAGAPGAPETSAAQLAFQQAVDAAKEKALKFRMQSVDGLATSTTEKFGGTREHTDREVPPKTGPGDSSRIGVVRNPDGTAAGVSPAGEANEANTQTSLRLQANAALRDLRADIAKNPRVLPGTPEYQDRLSLFAKAKIAVGSVSSLGKSDEALKTETQALGPPGSGVWSPSLKILDGVINHNVQAERDQVMLHTAKPGAVDDNGTKLPARAPTMPSTPAASPTPGVGGTKQVPIDPTPEHPHGGTGFINSDGTKEIRWNR